MANYEHLPLIKHIANLDRRKRENKGGYSPFPEPEGGRDKQTYFETNDGTVSDLLDSFDSIKERYTLIDPSLIFKLQINHEVDYTIFANELAKMGISILCIANDKKGYWIAFSNDNTLEAFKSRLAQYSGIVEGNKYPVFNVIETLEKISTEEKIGHNLRDNPVGDDEISYLNMEVWRMDNENIDTFISSLKLQFNNREIFDICDQLVTASFALFRIKIKGNLLNDILQFNEVSFIDRPTQLKFNPFELQSVDVNDLTIYPPDENSTGILIFDSGVTAGHPLLSQAIGEQQNYQEIEDNLTDTVGHGTSVAGCCLYGDLESCLEQKTFKASNYLYSAKVMYGVKRPDGVIIAQYDDRKLLENQLQDALTYFLNNTTFKIKVVNISLGNSNEVWHESKTHQFPLASLIDEFARQYQDVVFLVSSGNQDPRNFYDSIGQIVDNYPNYLVDDNRFKIINPGTASLALTVGSISPGVRIFDRDEDVIWTEIAEEDHPSPFTRSGFCLNKMIKPEFVEYGGNLILSDTNGYIRENMGSNLLLLSNVLTNNLFRFDKGTSFSTPKIANTIGKISNKFPSKSSNFIKNLAIQSASYPLIPNLEGTNSEKEEKLLRLMGYGLPNYEKAIFSFENRVVLFDESQLGIGKVAVYTVNVPNLFLETSGRKRLSIVLTYNPLTRSTRGDSYIANAMDFRLYHSVTPETVASVFSTYQTILDEELSPTELRRYEFTNLNPTVRPRKSSCHQKGIVDFKTKSINNPLSLAVISYDKWNPDVNFLQNYCISICIEHEEEIDIYNEINVEIQTRLRVRT